MKITTLVVETNEVQDWDSLVLKENSRKRIVKGETKQLKDFVGHRDSNSASRLYYAQAGVHTGDSMITVADRYVANIRNATVIPDFVHVLTSTNCSLAERFGSFVTFPKWMASYGPYFGYNMLTADFSGPYHLELAEQLTKPIDQYPHLEAPFLLSTCKNDKTYAHFLLQICTNLFRCGDLLIKYKPPLLFTYEPSRWQLDIMLSLFPWLKDFTLLICRNPTKFNSLIVPTNFDEPHIDVEFFNFLRSKVPQDHSTFSKRVYITRNDARTRRILNEPELTKSLERYGYAVYDMSKMTFADEMRLFHGAREIIYISGSHCVNTIFCSPAANVCTIQSFKSNLSTKYLLNNFGVQNIEYQVTHPSGGSFGHNEDFSISVTEFLEFLEQNGFA